MSWLPKKEAHHKLNIRYSAPQQCLNIVQEEVPVYMHVRNTLILLGLQQNNNSTTSPKGVFNSEVCSRIRKFDVEGLVSFGAGTC